MGFYVRWRGIKGGKACPVMAERKVLRNALRKQVWSWRYNCMRKEPCLGGWEIDEYSFKQKRARKILSQGAMIQFIMCVVHQGDRT